MHPARVFAFTLLLATFTLAFTAAGAGAAVVTTNLSQGHLSADVMFEASGHDLIITLSNSSTADVTQPTDVLTGLFFNTRTGLSLTPVSARIADGSMMLFAPQPADGNVGGEWAYNTFTPAQFDYAYGIGASGLSLFGPADRFDPTQNLGGPASMAGIDFGLVSAADNPATGNTPVTGKTGLIKHAVVFTLTGLPDGWNPMQDLIDLRVEFGSGIESPFLATPPGDPIEFLTVIPAPGSFWAGVVLMLLGCILPRMRRKV